VKGTINTITGDSLAEIVPTRQRRGIFELSTFWAYYHPDPSHLSPLQMWNFVSMVLIKMTSGYHCYHRAGNSEKSS